jgi:hypothetical protein
MSRARRCAAETSHPRRPRRRPRRRRRWPRCARRPAEPRGSTDRSGCGLLLSDGDRAWGSPAPRRLLPDQEAAQSSSLPAPPVVDPKPKPARRQAPESWWLTTTREAGQDRRQDRPPRQLRRVPAGRGRGAASLVRRDLAPDRSAQTNAATAPGMSPESHDRQQRSGQGASMTTKVATNPALTRGASLKDRFCVASKPNPARETCLPHRSGA